jgi:hypothetical protein
MKGIGSPPLQRPPADLAELASLQAPAEFRRLPLRYVNWAIVLVYGVVVLAIVPLHQPWRDEAHAWLLSRDLSVSGLFAQLHYEGYPPLWFLLQMPLAKLGLPYESLGLLNAILATGAVAILVLFSPFSLWQKAIIALSDGLLCQYGMVWRCYSLAVLALFLVAAVYPHRRRRPIVYAACVVLLASVHLLTLGVAVLFLGFFVIELTRLRVVGTGQSAKVASNPGDPLKAGRVRPRKAERARAKTDARRAARPPEEFADRQVSRASTPTPDASGPARWAAALVMVAGVALIIAQLVQPADCRSSGVFPEFKPMAPCELVSGAFSRMGFNNWEVDVLCLPAFAVVLWDLWRNRTAFWLLSLTFLGWSYVFTFKNMGPYFQHVPLMTTAMIVAFWLARTERDALNLTVSAKVGGVSWREHWRIGEVVLWISLLLGIPNVAYWIAAEVRHPFSGGKEAADAVRQVSASQPIAALPLAECESLLPYLPGRRFWSVETRRFATFHTPCTEYDSYRPQSSQDLLGRIEGAFPGQRPWLLLGFDIPPSELPKAGYELAFHNRQPPWYPYAERFWLYRPVGR